jgi:hypothetical protein
VALAGESLSVISRMTGATDEGASTLRGTSVEYVSNFPPTWTLFNAASVQLGRIELLRNDGDLVVTAAGTALIADSNRNALRFISPRPGSAGSDFEAFAAQRSRYRIRDDRLQQEP